MNTEQSTALQATDGKALSDTEATHAGFLVAPAVDIFENHDRITLLADMPGVEARDLKVDINEGVLTVTGHVNSPEGGQESDISREYRVGTFQRKFTLSESIDQELVEAKLSLGVLRLELPKVDRARVRKITVKTS